MLHNARPRHVEMFPMKPPKSVRVLLYRRSDVVAKLEGLCHTKYYAVVFFSSRFCSILGVCAMLQTSPLSGSFDTLLFMALLKISFVIDLFLPKIPRVSK